jgi:hypothetical protein
MATISLKLPDELLATSGRCADVLKLSRAAYIRLAVDRLNKETQAAIRSRQIAKVSRRVRRESMKVNREFSRIERATAGPISD